MKETGSFSNRFPLSASFILPSCKEQSPISIVLVLLYFTVSLFFFSQLREVF